MIPEEFLGGYAYNAKMWPASPRRCQRAGQAAPEDRAGRGPEARAGTAPGVVLVDDYDVLTAGGGSPLREFTEHLAMGAEIGLHALVARRVRGAGRGLFDPFSTAVREAGGATFLMDGDKSEGALINSVRPRRQPPGRGLFIHGGRPPATIQTIFREGPHDTDAS